MGLYEWRFRISLAALQPSSSSPASRGDPSRFGYAPSGATQAIARATAGDPQFAAHRLEPDLMAGTANDNRHGAERAATFAAP